MGHPEWKELGFAQVYPHSLLRSMLRLSGSAVQALGVLQHPTH